MGSMPNVSTTGEAFETSDFAQANLLLGDHAPFARHTRSFTVKLTKHGQTPLDLPSCGLNRTWRTTLNSQFQFGRVLFALAGRRLSGNVRQIAEFYGIHL